MAICFSTVYLNEADTEYTHMTRLTVTIYFIVEAFKYLKV